MHASKHGRNGAVCGACACVLGWSGGAGSAMAAWFDMSFVCVSQVLLVLDDIWDGEHAKLLNCVDAECGSASVITTRLRNMSEGEISCGLLTKEESISLLLTSAGKEDLISAPPAAAYEAVECCGRLALALPIAGGMIHELREIWETELVPMLKAELSEELSTEQRIVNASLKCIDESQRKGVEALFVCFGCFAEDEIVPASALDILAPIVNKKAGVASQSHLRVRKYLASLLRGSILNESTNGFSVHGNALCHRALSSLPPGLSEDAHKPAWMQWGCLWCVRVFGLTFH